MKQTELQLPRARGEIEPYLSSGDGRWTLVHGDAAETLARFPDRSVDLIFADVPYGLSGGGTTCSGGERVSVDKGAWDAPMTPAESVLFHERWLEQAQQVLRPEGSLWISGTHHCIFEVGFALRRLGFHVLNLITWQKPAPPPHLAGRYFCHSTEQIIWAAPRLYDPLRHVLNYGDMKLENGGKQMKDVWTIGAPRAEEKRHGRHPTAKPVALLDRIIRSSSLPGALVVDPFCGGGSAGVAALALGRRFIGVDLDSSYLDLTARRLSAIGGDRDAA